MAYTNKTNRKESQKYYHDRKSVVREFEVGDFVLVFRPIKRSKLENLWQGPYPISKRVMEVTYQIDQGTTGKRFCTFHGNCMTMWTSPVPAAFMTLDKEGINEQTEEISNLIETLTKELNKLKEKFKDVI